MWVSWKTGKSGSGKRKCFNCGSESHLVKNSPGPVNYSCTGASRILKLRSKKTPNAVHIVLAHLCRELDDPTPLNSDDSADDGDLFEEMLVCDAAEPLQNWQEMGKDAELENLEIYAVQTLLQPTADTFWGACNDSGAQNDSCDTETGRCRHSRRRRW